MSYIRFEDLADGIYVFFDDYQDLAPFGVSLPDAKGCGTEDDFFEKDIATLARNVPHTIRFVIDFYDGPRNDVVKNTLDADGGLKLVQSKKTLLDLYRPYASNFLYNAAGAVEAMRLGNGRWENTEFNSRLQPTKIGLGSGASPQNLHKLVHVLYIRRDLRVRKRRVGEIRRWLELCSVESFESSDHSGCGVTGL